MRRLGCRDGRGCFGVCVCIGDVLGFSFMFLRWVLGGGGVWWVLGIMGSIRVVVGGGC